MSYTQLIHELLDGTLDQSNEESLFLALASNNDLRDELKQFIQFDLAVKNDVSAFQPSPDSQSKIFATLGIPLASSIVGATAGATTVGSLWFSKLWHLITLGISSAIVGGILSFFIFTSNDTLNNIIENGIVKNEQFALKSNENISSNNNEKFIDTVYTEKTVVKYIKGEDRIVYVNSIETDSSTNSQFNSNQLLTQSDIVKNDDFVLSENLINNKSYIEFDKSDFNNNLISFEENNSFLNRLNIEFKGNEDWSINDVTIPRSSYPAFNNSSISLLYDINKNLKAGIDVRQEYFYQKYNGLGDDNINYNYFQHTNYVSAGILARYDIYNYNSTKFFVQPAISLNQVGAVGRTMVGTEFTFFEQISLILGLEASVLQFRHQGNNFYSPKISLHYGVRINP